MMRRAAVALVLLCGHALCVAQCGVLASAANFPVYGSVSMSIGSGTVSNGSTTNSFSGSGKAINQDTGALVTPMPPPTLPALSPSSFPANASVTDSSATNLSAGSYRAITVNSSTTFAAGTYYIGSLTLQNSAIVNFGAGTYYIGTLTLDNQGALNVTSGTVRLNIGTALSMHDKNDINIGGSASAMQIFLYPGVNATVHDSNKFTGLLYAPDSASNISVHAKISLTGAVIGSNIDMGSGAIISYPPAVKSALTLVSSCPIGAVDHYELSLPSTGISCLASSVSVTACANSSSPCSNPATGLSGQTATLASSAGALAASTLVFDAAGQASTTLSHAAASNGAVASVTLSGEQTAATNPRKCCPDGSPCATGNSCAITYTTAGFIIAAGANGAATTLPTQIAGTASANFTLRAVKTNTTTKACEAALAGANTVNWGYVCSNPATCSASNLMSINGGTATTVQRNNSGAVVGYTAVAMTFDANGNAPFNFTFSDVGQVSLWANKTVAAAPLSGSSNAFVSKPAGFALSAIAQAAAPNLANPAAASAAGAKFVKAGESFGATVTALTSSGAAAPNFGKEASPESVLLNPTLVLPAGGATGTLANASLAGASFSSGVASVSNLAWSEVGILTLTPNLADADYLGAGPVSGTPSGNIGRFIPDHFALTTGSATPACSAAFSYFGQDGFATSFTLRAEAIGNSVTQNYSGSFARLDANQWSAFGFSATGLPAGATLAASATPPSGSWANGVASINARHQVSRPAAPVAEAGVTVRAAPVDGDGVALASSAVAASTPLRFGRLRLSNAFSSARASLQLPVVAEYWRGTSWVLNSADSCTSVPAASVALSNPRNASGASSAASTSASAINLASGSGLLSLAAPSPAGSSLTLDLALNLGSGTADQSCLASHPLSVGAAMPWLRAQNGSCAASADRDPAARASFGIYSPESRKTVHVRELF